MKTLRTHICNKHRFCALVFVSVMTFFSIIWKIPVVFREEPLHCGGYLCNNGECALEDLSEASLWLFEILWGPPVPLRQSRPIIF